MLSTGGCKFGSLSLYFFLSLFFPLPLPDPYTVLPIQSIFPLHSTWKPRELFLAGRACYKTEESVYGGLGLNLLFLPPD